jgi:predicted outer membrane repeat protein
MDFRSVSFDSNFALDGGAVYNGGISNIYDSTFMDNFSEDGVRRVFL